MLQLVKKPTEMLYVEHWAQSASVNLFVLRKEVHRAAHFMELPVFQNTKTLRVE